MNSEKKSIYVTKPSLPPLEEFTAYLSKIWDSRILTNDGPFHHQFEKELADYLGIRHISLFVNGTLALITALQTLRITGEVITTPFSFVATTHSLWWNGIKPVFVDIEPDHFTINPERIEAAITPKTTAILPVHVYGYPCKVEAISKIADTYGLKVIYDAAHAFGVKINGHSVLNYGDLSILSFHATKAFHTIEGGAIISPDEKTKERIDFLKNFGYADEVTVVEPGINAKMNEVQSAFGLVQLKYNDQYVEKRKQISALYKSQLAGTEGIQVIDDPDGVDLSYNYFPILIESAKFGKRRDDVYEELKKNNIYGRRYFYPLISHFPPYRQYESANKQNLPVAEKIAQQVLCLPLYPDLSMDDVNRITDIIRDFRE